MKVAKRSARGWRKPAPDAGEITVEEAEYPRYLKAAFEREKIPKPAAKEGAKDNAKDGKEAAPRELTVAEMESLLLDRIEVGDDALKALALRRSEQVKSYLVGKGQLPAERVLVAAADTATPEKPHQSRVEFTLK